MKKIIGLLLVLAIWSLPAMADSYIKMQDHTDASYGHGNQVPARDSESELWIGDGRIAFVTETRRYILDVENGKAYIMEMADTAYVETDLPLDNTKIFPPDYVQRLAMFPITGELKLLDGKKEIAGKSCRSHMIHFWVDYMNVKYHETEHTVWVTDDVPFDKKYIDVFIETFLTLHNFKPELIAQILEAGGWEMLSESVRFSEGQQILSNSGVIEFEEREPEADTYTIPDGYRKKEFLNPRG
ncbi:MAG: hypothetical protein KAV42_02555 [Candidatus Krumholzibacteria bacterium]|nr:hypothetical protein [Candidatus Krumholzibacteria bacterium]